MFCVMKYLSPVKRVIFFVLIIFLASCRNQEEEEVSHVTITADEVGTCPYGHTNLIDVPIICGTIIYTPGLKQDISDRKFIYYTRFPMIGNKPTSGVVCATCDFEYRQRSLSYSEKDDSDSGWTRSSNDPNSFRNPFSLLLQDFPKPLINMLVGDIRYTQHLRAGKVYIESESMSYSSKQSGDDIRSDITAWADKWTNKHWVEKSEMRPGVYYKVVCEIGKYERCYIDVIDNRRDDVFNVQMQHIMLERSRGRTKNKTLTK